jgi:peptidoglycan/xylan/chitin deacetylase (PgdA/CDA1 family)
MTTGRAALVAATAAAVALAVRSSLGSPVPLWMALAAFVAYPALVSWGVLSPSLEMFAEIVWRGPRGARGVALTFDDGPHPTYTRAVLEALDQANAKATFFVIGEKAAHHPELLREIAGRGHLIGVHGYEHDRGLAFRSFHRVRSDLARAVEVVTLATGERPRFYRPPIGQTNPLIARAAKDLGLVLVGWSLRGLDGIRADARRVAARIVPHLKDGAIVLLHDASERDDRRPAGPDALPDILQALRGKHLGAVRLDAWPDRRAEKVL